MLADLLVEDEEGAEWLEESIAKLNALLAIAGLQPHVEPRELDNGLTFSCSVWGYGGLHHLRRIAVYLEPKRSFFGLKEGKLPKPLAEGQSAVDDPVLTARYADGAPSGGGHFPHLIDHSDAEGFYVPQDFPTPLISEDILGGYVGSVQQLHAECLTLARAIGVPLDLDPESDEFNEAKDDTESDTAGWRAHRIAAYGCLQLLHACEASMKSGALLVFN